MYTSFSCSPFSGFNESAVQIWLLAWSGSVVLPPRAMQDFGSRDQV